MPVGARVSRAITAADESGIGALANKLVNAKSARTHYATCPRRWESVGTYGLGP